MGYVSDIHFDELDNGKKSLTAEKVIALPKECPQCHFAKPPKLAKCPNCGYIAQHHAEPIKPAAGMLLELNGDIFKVAPVAKKLGSKSETYGQLVWWATSKHYNGGWAAHKFREIYGVMPRDLAYTRYVSQPSPALASWIKSQNIKWAKGEAKRKARWSDETVNTGNGHAPASPPPVSANRFVAGTLCTPDDLENFR